MLHVSGNAKPTHLQSKDKVKMTKIQILNGDCLADQLKQTDIKGEFLVCRECLIDGTLSADNIDEFWTIRAKFISDTYNTNAEEYFQKTVSEFEKLKNLPENSEVHLWFENDLFCQTNMWFVLSFLSDQPNLKLYRIFPTIENVADTWKGFGNADTKKLEQAYTTKVQFKEKDIELGKHLWTAYRKNDLNKLKKLSKTQSACFRYLEEVCQAHIDRFPLDKTLGRPDKVIKEIIETKSKEFQTVFSEFSDIEGIYGFGDLQIKNIYDRQMQSH